MKHLILKQRYLLFCEKQNFGTKKQKTQAEIAAAIGVSQSTVSREYRRNALPKGGYDDVRAQRMAEERRSKGEPHNKKPRLLMWHIENMIIEEQLSPAQIVGKLWKEERVRICKQTIYSLIHADKSGKLLENTRHKGKYSRHREPGAREAKASNIKDRVSIHDRPPEADGTRFGDWEMDLIIGKNGYGAILVLMERSTNYAIIRKLPHGKKAKEVAKAVVALLLAYRLQGVLTITTDNGSEFAEHKYICQKLKGVTVYFTDPYCSWQKGGVENLNKLIRQYIPKGTDFNTITDAFIMKVQKKLNRRPREKLNFSTPTAEFFKHFS